MLEHVDGQSQQPDLHFEASECSPSCAKRGAEAGCRCAKTTCRTLRTRRAWRLCGARDDGRGARDGERFHHIARMIVTTRMATTGLPLLWRWEKQVLASSEAGKTSHEQPPVGSAKRNSRRHVTGASDRSLPLSSVPRWFLNVMFRALTHFRAHLLKDRIVKTFARFLHATYGHPNPV